MILESFKNWNSEKYNSENRIIQGPDILWFHKVSNEQRFKEFLYLSKFKFLYMSLFWPQLTNSQMQKKCNGSVLSFMKMLKTVMATFFDWPSS